MAPVRITSKDGITAEWGGARDAQGVAAAPRGTAAPLPVATDAGARSRGGWPRALLRFVRSAALGVSLLVAVPMAVVAVRGGSTGYETTDMRRRIAEVERIRPLITARDASITPAEAGLAFHRLQSMPRKDADSTGFTIREVAQHGEGPWRTQALAPELFRGMGDMSTRPAMATKVLLMLPVGFSAQEMAYLRAVAEAPHWKDFETVANAPQVDLIGGQFVLPFRNDAFAPNMPILRYAETKELAYAGITRAAYYAASGQPDRAEAALRSVVSFGFALVDNGSYMLDALIGRIIVDIGRDALHQWYGLANDPGGQALTAPLPRRTATPAPPAGPRPEHAAVTARILADLNDPAAPRAIRLERLMQLSLSTCGSVRGMLFGPQPEVVAAFDGAKRSLGRFASERAYIDMVLDATNRLPEDIDGPRGLGDRLAAGAATVAGTVLGNPRVPGCTRLVQAFD